MPSDAPPPDRPARLDGIDLRGAGRRVLAFVVILALAAVALRALPGLGELRRRFGHAAPGWLALSVLAELASVGSFPVALRAAFSRVIPWRPAVTLGLVEQGANVLVPAGGTGGLAFGALWLSRLGVPATFAATRTVVLFLSTSLMTFLAVVGSGIAVGLGAGAGDVPAYAGALLAAGAALAIAAVWLLGRLGHPAGTPAGRVARLVARVRAALQGGARETTARLRAGDALLVAGAVGYLLFDIAALACAFEALGGGAPEPAAFVLAYAVGQAGALIPTPGGVGGTEGGLIGMFVLCGTPLTAATAAVLVYRVLQLGVPAILGVFASIDLRRVARRAPSREEIQAFYAAHPELTGQDAGPG